MTDLTYIEPPGLPDDIEVGATVEKCNREGDVLSTLKVVRVSPRRVCTDNHQSWSKAGWWQPTGCRKA